MLCRIENHITSDIKKKRFKLPKNTTSAQFAKIVYPHAIIQLEKQKGRCAFIGIALTVENIWTRFSLDRIDNNLPHFEQDGTLSNSVFVCRLFNGPKHLSSEIIHGYFLTQILVRIPDDVREKVVSILNNNRTCQKKRKITELE